MKDKHKEFALAAEAMLTKAKQLASELGATCERARCIQYLLDVRVVHHVFRKPDENKGTFKTLNAVGHQYCVELAALLQRTVQSPWEAPALPAAVPKTNRSGAFRSNIVEFAGGRVANAPDLLRAKGFAVDVHVTRTKDKERFRIVGVAADGTVELVDSVGLKITLFHESFLQGLFKVAPDAFKPE